MNLGEERIVFFYEIGRAISQWTHVEEQLRRTMLLCVQSVDRNAISDAFLSIENFRSKIAFADAAITRKFKDTEKIQPWIKLEEKLRTLSIKRNKLVHYHHAIYPDNEVKRRFAIIPWIPKESSIMWSEESEAIKPPLGALCILDIVAFRHEFHTLTTSLANFYETVMGNEAPFPALPVQSMTHLISEDRDAITDQIRQELQQHDLSSQE